ncbi:hypothetical protein BJV82DRAFT_177720 [Fennellomyces sp. T-0311]|nr:hypothetical protein BJV82DRAFT_177720 [Fennellomyces sp. T-0311]
MSEASSFPLHWFQAYFVQATDVPSLDGFYAYNPQLFLENCPRTDIKNFWNKAFRTAATKFNVQIISKKQPNWLNVYERLLDGNFDHHGTDGVSSSENATDTTTEVKTDKRSLGSASRSATRALTDDQWQAFEQQYRCMQEDRKWRLPDGTVVEDEMYKYAKTCSTEHAIHSFILDIQDEWVKKMFTAAQIRVMETYNCSPLPPVPECVANFFQLIEDKHDFEDLCAAVRLAGPYNEVEESDADWAQLSLRDLLRCYRWGVIKSLADRNSEKDIILRVWRIIDTAFDNMSVHASRCDKASVAMSARLNKKRRISEAGLAPKLAAWKPDLLLTKDEVEYGCSENGGKEESGGGTKETVEKWLKVPKLLKDMLDLAAQKLEYDETLVRQLKVIGFIHTHLRVSMMLLDSPAGYVTRLSRTRDYEVPIQKERVTHQLLPILKLILKAKVEWCALLCA